MSDVELLKAYIRDQSQVAFSQPVERHINLVFPRPAVTFAIPIWPKTSLSIGFWWCEKSYEAGIQPADGFAAGYPGRGPGAGPGLV